jgi:hypothetical protein
MPCSAPPPFGSEINESEPADAFAIDPTPWRPTIRSNSWICR